MNRVTKSSKMQAFNIGFCFSNISQLCLEGVIKIVSFISYQATTVFNIGAAPFIASPLLSSSSAIPPSVHPDSNGNCGADPPTSDNNRLFPWSSRIIVTSTPNNPNNNNTKDYPRSHQIGVNGSDANKDMMELNNRLNAMCGLGPASAIQSTRKSVTTAPGNILRHLHNNNNIIMGNILQETNPPPLPHAPQNASQSVMGPRSASDYRAYFNSNLINADNDHLVGGGGNFLQRVLTNNNNINQVPTDPAGVPPLINGPMNGLYYRFDMENNHQYATNNNGQVMGFGG